MSNQLHSKSDGSGAKNKPSLINRELLGESDWMRMPRSGERICGLCRSTLYQLIQEGKIRSVSIKPRGNARGKRLIYAPSVSAYIASFDSGYPVTEKVECRKEANPTLI